MKSIKTKIVVPKSADLYTGGIVKSEEELHAILRLREGIYRDELHYVSSSIPSMRDRYDDYSVHFYLKYDNKIVGTARLTNETKGPLELAEDVNWRSYVREDRIYCEITRRMFLPEHRNLFATFLLFKLIYQECLEQSTNGIVFAAEGKWEKYYKCIGFKMVPEPGFILNTLVNSPIYKMYYAYFDELEALDRFSQTIRSRLSKQDDSYQVENFSTIPV